VALIHDFRAVIRVAGVKKQEATAKQDGQQIRVTIARDLSAERKDQIGAICGETFKGHPILIDIEPQRNRYGFAEIPQVETKEEEPEVPPTTRFWLYREQGGGHPSDRHCCH
jgi:hypothetical protein